MTTILTIIGMMIIGSIIGGFTNFVAIKMLFHPYHEKKILVINYHLLQDLFQKEEMNYRKSRLMVTNHLLTPEVFKEKLVNPNTKSVLEDTIKVQFKTLKRKKLIPQDFINRIDYPLKKN